MLARVAAESPRNRSGSDSAGHSGRAAAAVAGRVALVAQHPLLVAAHPGHDRGVGDVAALDDDVDLAGHAGRALERAEVAHGRQVLRHERGQVRLDLGLRVGDPAHRGQHEPGGEHAPRAPDARGEHAPPERRPAAPRRRAASARAHRARRARASGPRRAAAVTPASANSRATPIPATSTIPNPRTIGTGESRSTRKPAAVASAAVAIVASAAGGGRPGPKRDWYWIA